MTRFLMTPSKTFVLNVGAGTLAWWKIGCQLERLYRKEFGFPGIRSTIDWVLTDSLQEVYDKASAWGLLQ